MNILLSDYNMVHTFSSFQDVLTMSVVSIPYARMDASCSGHASGMRSRCKYKLTTVEGWRYLYIGNQMCCMACKIPVVAIDRCNLAVPLWQILKRLYASSGNLSAAVGHSKMCSVLQQCLAMLNYSQVQQIDCVSVKRIHKILRENSKSYTQWI